MARPHGAPKKTVEISRAERIGCATSIILEPDTVNGFAPIAKSDVAVKLDLSSNEWPR